MKRRQFLQGSVAAGALSLSGMNAAGKSASPGLGPIGAGSPVVACTWDYGEVVPKTAYDILAKGGSLLDAVEEAVKIPEADPAVTSVGKGGYPDRDGKVSLDASIMDGSGNCGSVAFLERILHPISVARRVMEKTDHVMLVGAGALQFAREQGYSEEELLTPEASTAYRTWLKTSGYKSPVGAGNHDTIGLLAMNAAGKLAGACTTSGMAWKVRGRVGDSPIIGAGLFVDDGVGAATSTGIGEAVIKIAGSHTVVELMRNGRSPQEACRLALQRILEKQPRYRDEQSFLVGFLAINARGEVGGCSYRAGYQYAVYRDGTYTVVDAEHLA